MRRFFLVVLIALFGVPLTAASPPPFSTKPSVIVYPFTANGSTVNREASSQLATIIATQMANTGRVSVIPPPPGTERKDFLSVARAHNADYYIAGFISGLGDGVSVVEQVVTTSTGIVMYSNTVQLQTYADAAGQGDEIAIFVQRHANRAFASIGTPPPASTPSPQPANETSTSLNKLFGRKKKPAASAKPSPAPSAPAAALVLTATPAPQPIRQASAASPTPAVVAAAAAASGIAVLPIGGGAAATLRELAQNRAVQQTHGERTATAAAACGDHPHEAIMSGELSSRADPASTGRGATFDAVVKNCSGTTLWHGAYSADASGANAAETAVERAVDLAVNAYLHPPKKGKRGG